VRLGALATVTLDAHPGRTFTAKVTRLFPGIDHETHTRTIEGSIGEDVALAPGMFARLSLILATVHDALTVPIEAVVRRDGKPVVFVIAGGGTVRQRAVTPGVEDSGRVQIIKGVNKGETVAVVGHNRLRDGMKVRVMKAEGGGTPR
jgi:RND family efflux transporter MFP subunit